MNITYIVSLRSASFRALRSNLTTTSIINTATKCTTYLHRLNAHQQQHLYSTFSPSLTRILSIENDKYVKHVSNLKKENFYFKREKISLIKTIVMIIQFKIINDI